MDAVIDRQSDTTCIGIVNEDMALIEELITLPLTLPVDTVLLWLLKVAQSGTLKTHHDKKLIYTYIPYTYTVLV